MTEIRARVDAIVDRPGDRRGLKPWYRQLCKRPCFHDEYLQAYNEPGAPPRRHRRPGRRAHRRDRRVGERRALRARLPDLRVGVRGRHRATPAAPGYETIGRDGVTPLASAGPTACRPCTACHVHGFPNLFIVGISQAANLISNITHNLTEAGTTIAAVDRAHARGRAPTEVEVDRGGRARLGGRLESNVGNRSSATPTARPATTTTRASAVGRPRAPQPGGYPGGPVALLRVHRRAGAAPATSTGLEFR